jgi:hypothetical protein
MSTTYLAFDPVHGCFFSGGNNGYVGYGSHVFGYTAGQVATDGSVNGGTNGTGADHSNSGTFCTGFHQGTGNQYFMTFGFGNSYMSTYRLHTATSAGITIGSTVQHPAAGGTGWSSGGHNWQHVWQPDATVAAGEVEAGCGGSFAAPDQRGWTLSRSGSCTEVRMDGGYNSADFYQGAGGVPFISQRNQKTNSGSFYGTMGNTNNNFTSLEDGDHDFGGHIVNSSGGIRDVGIGQNKFLMFRRTNAAFGDLDMCELVGIDANQNAKKLAHLSINFGDDSIMDKSDEPQNRYVVYENDSDTYPKWLVCNFASSNRHQTVQVYEIIADFAEFTI